jgi:hypothetical protein
VRGVAVAVDCAAGLEAAAGLRRVLSPRYLRYAAPAIVRTSSATGWAAMTGPMPAATTAVMTA